MTQKQMDTQDQKLRDLKRGLQNTSLTPANVFTALRFNLGFGEVIALKKVKDWCKSTDYITDFTAKQLYAWDI